MDATGKIYVVNGQTVTTSYNPDGKEKTPTIDVGRPRPTSVEVDAIGKIYAGNMTTAQ